MCGTRSSSAGNTAMQPFADPTLGIAVAHYGDLLSPKQCKAAPYLLLSLTITQTSQIISKHSALAMSAAYCLAYSRTTLQSLLQRVLLCCTQQVKLTSRSIRFPSPDLL